MKLPVMADRSASAETLWRRYVDIAFDHAQALGEEADVAGGRAVVRPAPTPDRPTIVWAELDDASAAHATDFLTHTAIGGTIVSAGGRPIDGIARAAGWYANARQLVRLTNAQNLNLIPTTDVILPARAAFAAVTSWCEARSAESFLLHLDDPHYEAFVLLRNGVPLAIAGLQSRGQVGLICDAFVEPDERRRGLGRRLLHRLIELAARAQLPDVFATHGRDDSVAAAWLADAGFHAVRSYTAYTANVAGVEVD